MDTYEISYPNKKDKEYPYCEFKFANILPNNEISNKNILQIDVWDNRGNDIEKIETITANIYDALVNKSIKTDGMFLKINRNSPCVLTLPDPEIDIQRRELRFIVTVYKRNMSL